MNPGQFRKAARLVARHPGIPIVVGHLGSPTLADLRDGKVYWEGLAALADLEPVHLKISMLSYTDGDWDRNSLVRDSVHRAMDLFGPGRCMFASNFPVEKHVGWPAARLLAAFRDLASHLGAADRKGLFADQREAGVRGPGHRLPVSGVPRISTAPPERARWRAARSVRPVPIRSNAMRLKGKNTIVTGAGAGIGRATAIRFAEEGGRG